MTKQQPEALAAFAQSARAKNKRKPGTDADNHTKPVTANSEAEHEAATKVLQEGVTGEDKGSDDLIDNLPDRISDSR